MKNVLIIIALCTTKAIFCSQCPSKCTSCSSLGICTSCDVGYSLYGQSCTFNCPIKCKSCEDGVCPTCKRGYYGTLCENQCDVDCLSEHCDKETGWCAKEEQGKTTEGVKCKDTDPAQPCADVCPENCETCDASNRCVSCKKGFWGGDCNAECSGECGREACDRTTGMCAPIYLSSTSPTAPVTGSEEGIVACPIGQYGDECKKTCPKNCINSLCFRTNGSCVSGCVDGYYGYRCKLPCLEKNCKTGCYRRNGICLDPCANGTDDESCEQASATGDNNNKNDDNNNKNGDNKNGDNNNKNGDNNNKNGDDSSTKIIIGAAVGSLGVAIATIVVVVILVMRMRLRKARADGLQMD